jgi:thiol-disulfide isomerase/thioredoxin
METIMDRRTVLGGMVAVAASGIARAVPSPRPLFQRTPFATNPVARRFDRVDFPLPPIELLGARGPVSLRSLRGRTTILALWAEWCAPCLIDLRDFAALRRKYAGPRFDIVSLLTYSKRPLDYRGAHDLLAKMTAADLPLLIEPNGGTAAISALSTKPDAKVLAALPPSFRPKGTLPCTLLVDSSGTVRGRSVGAVMQAADSAQRADPASSILTEHQKRVLNGASNTSWSTPDGDAFVRALASGLLDRRPS